MKLIIPYKKMDTTQRIICFQAYYKGLKTAVEQIRDFFDKKNYDLELSGIRRKIDNLRNIKKK